MLLQQTNAKITILQNLSDTALMRKTLYTVYNSLIKGGYRSKTDIISKDCLGDWMQPGFDNMDNIMDKLDKGDIFRVSKDEVKQAATDAVDFVYKNMDYCEIMGISEEKNGWKWCLDNIGVCVYQEDLFARLVTNAGPLLSKGMDLFNLFWDAEWECNNDTQNLELIDEMVTEISEMVSDSYGFYEKIDLPKNPTAELFD